MSEKEIIRGNASKVKSKPLILIILGLLIGVGGSFLVVVMAEEYMLPVMLGIGIPLLIAGIVLKLYVSSCEICVTDKRVFGKAAFGARVDIPMDSVSAVGTIGWLNGVSVASSSGSIKFLYIENATEIHEKMSQLIIDRQNNKAAPAVTNIKQEVSSADELKKYKDLLDGGVITQEEFDAKKKQLLGL